MYFFWKDHFQIGNFKWLAYSYGEFLEFFGIIEHANGIVVGQNALERRFRLDFLKADDVRIEFAHNCLQAFLSRVGNAIVEPIDIVSRNLDLGGLWATRKK